tara:strand:- start:20824 stop:21447 length:624 start_codon:yes stop_codon:yes gene_type:complete
MKRILFYFAFLFFMPSINAAYITDKLVVGFYDQPSDKNDPIELLTSGTPIEILRVKEKYTKVRLTSNKQGWIESTYVTEKKPSNIMLLEAQAVIQELKQANKNIDLNSNSEIEKKLRLAEKKILQLEENINQAEVNNANRNLNSRAETAINILSEKEIDEKLGDQINTKGSDKYIFFYATAFLFLGGIIGFIASSIQSKRKFGGIKI